MKFFDRLLTIVITATLTSMVWIVFGSTLIETAEGETEAPAAEAPEPAPLETPTVPSPAPSVQQPEPTASAGVVEPNPAPEPGEPAVSSSDATDREPVVTPPERNR